MFFGGKGTPPLAREVFPFPPSPPSHPQRAFIWRMERCGNAVAFLSASVPRSQIPHVRGGVSGHGADVKVRRLSSPRPWGCFFRTGSAGPHGWGFPTPVGGRPVRGHRLLAASSCL